MDYSEFEASSRSVCATVVRPFPSLEIDMALDKDRIDDAVLALLYLGLHDHYRAWKGFDWDAMNRLHEKGMIDSPINKAKSVVFTQEGLQRSKELFERMFRKQSA